MTDDQRESLNTIISDFESLFTDVPGCTNILEHEINLLQNNPFMTKPYPLPFHHTAVVKEEITKMLDLGVIEKSESPFASPIVLVPKPDGAVRFCVDYRQLNKETVSDPEPIPDQEEIFTRLTNAKYFTKLDLAKGYWQIKMSEESKQFTAFTTPMGCFQWVRMPFGLKNAPATFARLMRRLFGDRQDVVSYFDDMCIYNDNWQGHLNSLREVLHILLLNGLTVRPSKAEIAFPEIDFLGHIVGQGKQKPMDKNVSKILNLSVPKSKKEVRSLIGLVNYYGRFLPHLATLLAPLSNLTLKGRSDKIQWDNECQKSLEIIQEQISNKPVLTLPNLSQPFIVQTDASSVGVGAALLQRDEDILLPVAFASRKLLPRETRYSVGEKECLAVVFAIQKFSRYLFGQHFTIQVDHRALAFLQSSRSPNGRLARWALALQEFDYSIEYISGEANVLADILSRLAV